MTTRALRIIPSSIRFFLRCTGVASLVGIAGCAPSSQATRYFSDMHQTFLAEDLRIDGYEQGLVPIGWLAVSSTGAVALIQAQDGGVRVFDRDGNSLGLIGRKGQGPGEFLSPTRGGWKGDTLWVYDVQARRVTVISPDQSIARMFTIRPAQLQHFEDGSPLPEYHVIRPSALLPGDTMLATGIASLSDPVAQSINGTPLFHATSDGAVHRVILLYDSIKSYVPVRFDGNYGNAMIPFYIAPRTAMAPDGSRVVKLNFVLDGQSGGMINVRLYDGSVGSVVLEKSYPFKGVPVPSAVLDSVVAASAAQAFAREIRKVIEGEARDRASPIYPPVKGVFLADNNRIWIGLRETEDGNPWIVLDDSGRALFRVVVPAAIELRAAGGNHAWGIERDPLDVESVVRFSLAAMH
jgi:hypothetical protein